MVRFICMVMLLGLLPTFQPSVYAQDSAAVLNAIEQLEKLRSQLREVQTKEAEVQERVRQIDIELQPDNLQRAVSRIPSLNPGDLREERRRQLEAEKSKAQSQLPSLADSRMNLEKAIFMAEGEVVRLRGQRTDMPVKSTPQATAPKTTESKPSATERIQQPQVMRKSKTRASRQHASLRMRTSHLKLTRQPDAKEKQESN